MLINRRAALTLSAGMLFAAMAPAGLARAQGRKTLRIAPHAALRVLDPVVTNAYITRNHGYMVYDTLFSVDAQYRPQPQMVQDWSVSADALVWTFTLRDGLAFHDGQPVTPADCIASIARWAKKDVVGLRLAAVTAGMEAVDAKTFRITLKEPFGPMLEGFARPSSIPLFVMPGRIAALPPETVLEEVVGSGPFRFIPSEFRPGVSWAYERNDKYVPRAEPPSALAGGKAVKVDRVEIVSFPSKQTAINALAKGEIDLIENIGADQRALLQDNTDVVVRRRVGLNASTIRFNWAQPPFDNVKMRQAVQAVVTQQDYMDTAIGDPGSYQLCPALFGCGTPLETAAGFPDTGTADIAKAKALLQEAGYNGEKIVIITPGDIASFAPLAPLTQQVLRQIGTGSTGIQAVPVIAETAQHLTVFQRTANFSVPARNAPLAPEFKRWVRENYDAIREVTRATTNGHPFTIADRSALAVTEEERQALYEKAWEKGGLQFRAIFRDLLVDKAANDTAVAFLKAKIRAIVQDPKTAALLTAFDHPYATKRPPIDTDYFETYNRDNVTLVDVRADPIERVTPRGIQTRDAEYPLDIIVFATGFDAMTGPLLRMDIRGRGGLTLQEAWDSGPRTYLGLQVAGFPNLFTVTGPGSPSVLCNMPVAIEQHAEWIADCIAHLRERGLRRIEARPEAVERWVTQVNEAADATLLPQAASSWYLGANVPGKPRVFMPYTGGMAHYRSICDGVAARGYEGFALTD